jgi:hypothetical protein
MDTLVELFRESVIMRGLLALVVTGAVIYMLLTGMTVPPELYALLGTAWGFFFGSQPATNVARAKELADLKATLNETRGVG